MTSFLALQGLNWGPNACECSMQALRSASGQESEAGSEGASLAAGVGPTSQLAPSAPEQLYDTLVQLGLLRR